jgi:hypothetical protein
MAVPRKAGQLPSVDPGTLAASRRRSDPGQASVIACLPIPILDADATLPVALWPEECSPLYAALRHFRAPIVN